MTRGRARLVTALDCGLIVAASAAAVVLLGGRTRVDVGVFRVTLHGATNLLLAAAVLGAARLLLGRRVRPLPSAALPDRTRIETERERFVHAQRPTRTVWMYACATLLGSTIWILPHVRDLRLVRDPGDPVFSAWRIARLAHQITHEPSALFDGNIFYPRTLTLTYSDSTFLQGLLGTPFIAAGTDPIVVANALTLIAFPMCGLAFFFAAWRLTDDPRAAVIAGLVGAWHPFHAEHYSHLELQWTMFVPIAVIAALRMTADPRPANGLRLGAALAAQWLASMYLGVMLLTFLAPFVCVVIVAWRPPWRRFTVALVTCAAVAAPAFAGLAIPYLKTRDARGDRDLALIGHYSASADDYTHADEGLAAYASRSRVHRDERDLFPGASPLVLAAIGAWPPLTAAAIGTVAAGTLAFDWSLGPNGLTYDELLAASTVHRGMRSPARFSALVGATLALLSGFGAARLLRVSRRVTAKNAVCASLAILVLFDLRLRVPLQPYWRTIPSIYSRVTPDMVLIELPQGHEADFMYFSTTHWARLVGGYSGFAGFSEPLWEGWNAWPSSTSIASFRRAGATHLTYNCALEEYPWRCANVLAMLDAAPGLELMASGLWQGKQSRLYRLK